MITLEEYQQAQQIVKDYRVCGGDGEGRGACKGHGCGKMFKVEDTTRTIQWGQEYYWCATCYESVKDDW